ncbi:unnamed protein product [Angiostrongylus costaricensis]|uniref:Uncharacterized protein n=1 Tax=Angiostrongylus costaricensis TaxID=334426 RepID=A0A0R3Q2L3_ANGCS|nr:unnamed protein product [Angiostrongylus costaricensis]
MGRPVDARRPQRHLCFDHMFSASPPAVHGHLMATFVLNSPTRFAQGLKLFQGLLTEKRIDTPLSCLKHLRSVDDLPSNIAMASPPSNAPFRAFLCRLSDHFIVRHLDDRQAVNPIK